MPYSARARTSPGGSPYFLQDLEDRLVETAPLGSDADYFSDYDTISPWRRDF